jgi:hypothetical protein
VQRAKIAHPDGIADALNQSLDRRGWPMSGLTEVSAIWPVGASVQAESRMSKDA